MRGTVEPHAARYPALSFLFRFLWISHKDSRFSRPALNLEIRFLILQFPASASTITLILTSWETGLRILLNTIVTCEIVAASYLGLRLSFVEISIVEAQKAIITPPVFT